MRHTAGDVEDVARRERVPRRPVAVARQALEARLDGDERLGVGMAVERREPTGRSEIAPMLTAAYGLSPRELEITGSPSTPRRGTSRPAPAILRERRV